MNNRNILKEKLLKEINNSLEKITLALLTDTDIVIKFDKKNDIIKLYYSDLKKIN